MTHQAPTSCPCRLAVAKQSRGVAVPHRSHSEPAPAGDQTDTKSFDSNTLQTKICLRLRVIWIQPGWPESSNDKASPGPVIKP